MSVTKRHACFLFLCSSSSSKIRIPHAAAYEAIQLIPLTPQVHLCELARVQKLAPALAQLRGRWRASAISTILELELEKSAAGFRVLALLLGKRASRLLDACASSRFAAS
eukprot:2349721-Pleurochrysis_carterae.AAC.1